MVAVVSIINRHGLSINTHHKNQCKKSKLVLYEPLHLLSSHLKQLNICNKMEHFSYKGGCDVYGYAHIEAKEELAWAIDK